MRTITELNGKAWYRFLKVIYVTLILLVSTSSVISIFQDIGSHQTDYLVTCNKGNKSTFLAYKDKGIYISYDWERKTPPYKGFTPEVLTANSINALQNACDIAKEEQFVQDSLLMKLGFTEGLFSINQIKVNIFTTANAFGWSLLSIAIILTVAEILRRIFYYILLGTLRPKKNA